MPRFTRWASTSMENLRAGLIMIACGEAAGRFSFPFPAPSLSLSKTCAAPLAYGATDVDLVTGTETSPHVTQSETFTAANPDNPNQIVVAYNDSRGAPVSQLLRRIGLHRRRHTFTRLTTAPAVKARSPIPLATLLFCTTANQHLVHGLARCELRRSGPRRVQVH